MLPHTAQIILNSSKERAHTEGVLAPVKPAKSCTNTTSHVRLHNFVVHLWYNLWQNSRESWMWVKRIAAGYIPACLLVPGETCRTWLLNWNSVLAFLLLGKVSCSMTGHDIRNIDIQHGSCKVCIMQISLYRHLYGAIYYLNCISVLSIFKIQYPNPWTLERLNLSKWFSPF